jgi:hypothetical protein
VRQPSVQLRCRSSMQWQDAPEAALLGRFPHAHSRPRTILSMPLPCSSTLDRRAPAAQLEIRRPTWRSFGARRICAVRKTAGKSSSMFCLRLSCAQRRGTFLSQAGPHGLLELSQAEHHLSDSIFGLDLTTKKATCWSPSPFLQYG